MEEFIVSTESDILFEDSDYCVNCTFTGLLNYTIDCSKQSAGPGILSTSYFKALVTCMYLIIFVVAFIGNGAVCFIVRAFPRMRTVTNYFIANLALGDILMSVFCVPFTFVPQLVLNHWPFGDFLCRLVNYSQVVSVLVSAYTLVALAADRYRAITAPLRPRLSKLKAKAAIAAVWVGALATALPTPIVSALDSPTLWHQKCHKSICRENWPYPEQFSYYSMALMILQFAVPLAVLIFTYARIALAVWGGRTPGEAENSRDKRMAKSKRKMIKMMVTVVIVYTMCWLPLNILIILWTIDEHSWETWEPIPYVWFAFHWLAMSHSCYNPIIYCYMNARFRYSFIQVASKVPCLKNYLDTIVQRAAHADLHNGVSGIGMTGNTLNRMNTCTSYVSLRKRAVRCSCSPARSTCSHTRSTCSSSIPTMSPAKTVESSPCSHSRMSCQYGNTLSPHADYCTSETCLNRVESESNSVDDTFHSPRNRTKPSSYKSSPNHRDNLNRPSPVRAASFLTSQGTVCAADRRHLYLEDQI